jgi:hypothetical protein
MSIRVLQMSADHMGPDQVVGPWATSGSALGGLVAADGLGFSPKRTPLVNQLSALLAVGWFSSTNPSISGTS